MKIEFIKEKKADGAFVFYTRIDDGYVSSSLSFNIDEAKEIYDNIVRNKGKYVTIEVLESVEISVA
jgi:hypothetical protein